MSVTQLSLAADKMALHDSSFAFWELTSATSTLSFQLFTPQPPPKPTNKSAIAPSISPNMVYTQNIPSALALERNNK